MSEVLRAKEVHPVGHSIVLSSVLGRNSTAMIRREIGIIADRSYREKLINDEAYRGYRDLAQNKEAWTMSEEMLESTRKFAVLHEARALRVHQKIKNAMRLKIASEVDEAFLMETLVVHNIDFAGKAEQVERLIDEKLVRMKADKIAYDELIHHPLVRNVGYLKTDPSTTIDIPGEDEFLEMTVPERRDVLKALNEALPKAEKYAEMIDKEGSKEREKAYRHKLDKRRDAGIIGRHTYDAFMDGFSKIDRDEQEYWLEDDVFNAEMEPYETLWAQIRDTLRGEALVEMTSGIDSLGYTELFAKFGHLKQRESLRLNASYQRALNQYLRTSDNPTGVIGKHTFAEFCMWMYQQDLEVKYEAEGQLPAQMLRYEVLWQEIDELKGKDQIYLKSKIDVWGYSELKAQLDIFKGNSAPGLSDSENIKNPLETLKSKENAGILKDFADGLTRTQKISLGGILRRAFGGKTQDRFDAVSFEGELEKRRRLAGHEMDELDLPLAADDEIDSSEIAEDLASLSAEEGIEVSEGDGFTQVEAITDFEDEDQEGRVAQAVLNRDEGMNWLCRADNDNAFRSEERGGNDDLSLAVDNGPRTVELDLAEIRALESYLTITTGEAANDNTKVEAV